MKDIKLLFNAEYYSGSEKQHRELINNGKDFFMFYGSTGERGILLNIKEPTGWRVVEFEVTPRDEFHLDEKGHIV